MSNSQQALIIDPRRHPLTINDYVSFRRDGYLLVRGLLNGEEVAELNAHCDDLWTGRAEVPGHPISPEATEEERKRAMLRLHMLHLHFEIQERMLLHPGILDVLEALIGPDVMAMQTMLFLKQPGSNGQGFHQDSYYIPTFPDTLCGAWIALEPVDEENGCLRMSVGSQHEPIYPPLNGYGYGNLELADIPHVENVGGQQNPDDDPTNTLKPIAEKYREQEIAVIMNPGDVVFFAGHVFHRSLRNSSDIRSRRSFVCHYANARSFTEWGGGNENHILARGATNLAFALPKFGTPCAANIPEESRARLCHASMMMGMPDGRMESRVTDPSLVDED